MSEAAIEEAEKALRRLRIWGAYLANIACGDVGQARDAFLASLHDVLKAINRDTTGHARRLLPAIRLMQQTFVANHGKAASRQLADELEDAFERVATLLRMPT